MRQWLLDMCLFTQEQLDLIFGNLQVYVYIACIAVIFHVFFSILEKVFVPIIAGVLVKAYRRLAVSYSVKKNSN